MARYICKITDAEDNKVYYFEWSTVVNAPVTHGMSLEEFRQYYEKEYGRSEMDGLERRLQRVEQNGISAIGEDLDELLARNHAGENGKKMSKKEILELIKQPQED